MFFRGTIFRAGFEAGPNPAPTSKRGVPYCSVLWCVQEDPVWGLRSRSPGSALALVVGQRGGTQASIPHMSYRSAAFQTIPREKADLTN